MSQHDKVMSGLEFEELQKTLVRIQPNHVNLNGQNTSPLSDVVAVCSIPLILGPKGSYYANATGFADFKPDEAHTRAVKAFQIMILACEDPLNGCPCINVNRETKPQLYWRVIESYCKCKNGNASTDDYKLSRSYVRGSYYINFQTQLDIADMMSKIKKEVNNEKKDTNNEEAVAEEEQELANDIANISEQHLQNAPSASEFAVQYRATNWRSIVEQFVIIGGNNRPKPDEPVVHDMPGVYNGPDVDRFNIYIKGMFPTPLHISGGRPQNIIDGENYATFEEIEAVTSKGVVVKPKVLFAITPVPSQNDPEYIQAYMVNFIIYDPLFNPGDTVHGLCDLTIQRDKNAAVGKFGKRWVDPYRRYRPIESTGFPAFNFDRDSWITIASDFIPEDKFNMQGYWKSKTDHFDSPTNGLHPYNVCNIATACRKMAEAGCDVRFLNPSSYYNAQNKTFSWPPAAKAYQYMPESYKWYNPRYIGLLEQDFPGHCVTDSILNLPFNDKNILKLYMETEDDRILSDFDRKQIIDSHIRRLKKSPMGQPVMKRAAVLEQLGFTISEFPTDNAMIRLWLMREDIEKRVNFFKPPHLVKLKKDFEREQKKGPNAVIAFKQTQRYIEWARYNRLIRRMREDFTKQLDNLCQKEGGRDYLSISDACKASLQWYEDTFIIHKGGKKGELDFTRDLQLLDKHMSFFGNSMVKQQELLVQYGKVMQPVVSMTVEHAYAIYDWTPGKLKFHLMYHGEKASGKTYGVINVPVKFSIPGMVTKVSHQTDMVKYTDSQIYDTIEMHDETDSRYTDAAQAAKTPRWRDLVKQALQAGFSQSEVFESIQGENGNKRAFRKFTTIQNYLMICVTNKELTDEDALAQRFVQKTMYTLVDVMANEFNWKNTQQGEKSAQTYMRMLHFFSCWAKKARQCGVMCSWDLSVWDIIFDGVVQKLKERGIEIDGEARIKEKLTNCIVQYVVHMTQHYLYDIEGVSPFYGQPFKVEHFHEAERRMVADSEMCGFVLNMFSEELMDTDAGNVLNAIPRMYGLKWDANTTMLDLFRSDIHNKMDFRVRGRDIQQRSNNGQQQQQQQQQQGTEPQGQKIDLNYVRVSGTKDEICKMIAAHTNPKLGANDVAGVLARLDGKFFHPSSGPNGRNGYACVPKDNFRAQFKSERVPSVRLNKVSLVEDLFNIKREYTRRIYRTTMLRYKCDDYKTLETPGNWNHYRASDTVALTMSDDTILNLYHLNYQPNTLLSNMIRRYYESEIDLPVARDDVPIEWWESLGRAANVSVEELLNAEMYQGITFPMMVAFNLALKDCFVRKTPNAGNGFCVRPVCNEWMGVMREEDIPDLDYGGAGGEELKKLKIIEVRQTSRGLCNVYAALEANFMFNPEMIYQAWLEVCMCKTFRVGKYLLGMVDPKYPTKLAARMMTEQDKDEMMEILAEEGDDRSQGITVRKRGEITPSIQSLLFDKSLTRHTTDDEWKRVCENEKSIRNAGESVIANMEKLAYYQQHMKAGFPLEEEVLSPQWYIDKYNSYHNNTPYNESFNYPWSLIREDSSVLPRKKKSKRSLHSRLQRITHRAEQSFYQSSLDDGIEQRRRRNETVIADLNRTRDSNDGFTEQPILMEKRSDVSTSGRTQFQLLAQ
jgi:hypothetical protein